MKHNRLPFLFTFLIFMASCSDKLNVNLLAGNYTGFFYYTPPGETKSKGSQEAVSLNLTGNTYSSTGIPDRIPAGGSGEFSVLNNNEVEFKDKNIWTADFDWKLILNGRFKYELKNDSLILTRFFEICATCEIKPGMLPGQYQYRLMRPN